MSGVHDLAGNVAEWTTSYYGSSPAARVTRGGGWNYNDAAGVRVAMRHRHAALERVDRLGFRCVR